MKMSNIMYIFLGLLKLWDFVDQYFAQNSFASRDVLAYPKCMYTEPVSLMQMGDHGDDRL